MLLLYQTSAVAHVDGSPARVPRFKPAVVEVAVIVCFPEKVLGAAVSAQVGQAPWKPVVVFVTTHGPVPLVNVFSFGYGMFVTEVIDELFVANVATASASIGNALLVVSPTKPLPRVIVRDGS